jgi:hypothetical protein
MPTSPRGRHSTDPDVVFVQPRRGMHESRLRQSRTTSERTRILLVVAGVVALFGVLATALSPFWANRNRGLPAVPVPAAVSQPPLGSGPTVAPPTQPPTAPPGFPTTIPTAASSAPTQPPADTTPVRQPIRPIVVEAESAANALRGEAQAREAVGASGGLVVSSIGADAGSTLRFAGIRVPAAGTYSLTVFYLSDPDRTASLRVNGSARTVAFPGTGDPDTVASLSLRVNLAAGANTVEFAGTGELAPDLDRLTVTG